METIELPAGKKLLLLITIEQHRVVALLREVHTQFVRHTRLRAGGHRTCIRRFSDDEITIGGATFVLTTTAVESACRWLAEQGILVEDCR